MKIFMKIGVAMGAGGKQIAGPNEPFELPDEEAKSLIERGLAEEVKLDDGRKGVAAKDNKT